MLGVLKHSSCTRHRLRPGRVFDGALSTMPSQDEYGFISCCEPQLADPAQAFKIPDIKFLLISASAKANAAAPRKRVNTLYLSTISKCTSPLTNDVSPISLKKSSASLQAKNCHGVADARTTVNPIAGSASVAARRSLLATNATTKQPTTRTSTLTA